MPYIPGDYWVICDVCGFKKRRSQTKKRWDGALVCEKDWEPRHPQDFVRNVKDHQAVADPRPELQTMIYETTLKSAAVKDATTIAVNSTSHIEEDISLGIALDSGEIQWTFATADPSGDNVTINNGLWGAAASGNTVYIMAGTRFQTSLVQASDL